MSFGGVEVVLIYERSLFFSFISSAESTARVRSCAMVQYGTFLSGRDAEEDGARVANAGGQEGHVGELAFVDGCVWMRGYGWTHGEELLLRSVKGVDFDFALGSFGARLQEVVEDGAAGVACFSEDGVGGHRWGLLNLV